MQSDAFVKNSSEVLQSVSREQTLIRDQGDAVGERS